jgi:hypothetical protein
MVFALLAVHRTGFRADVTNQSAHHSFVGDALNGR